MSLKFGTTTVTQVKFGPNTSNLSDVNKIIFNNDVAGCRPFTYTQGTLPTGVASLTCTRSSTDEPTASTGTIANGGTIYYYDKLYGDATASAGYRITAVKGSSSPVTVSGAITGTTASGVASTRISGTISQGTLPAEVNSITCYRKAYNENSFSKYTGSTIYYGDQFYGTATAATGYNNPSLTYNNSSKVYTWTGSQGGSINSVSASGLSAGTRKSFTISFGTTANKTLYGSWSSSSETAYYGDKITVSDVTVTCYKGDNKSTTRWRVAAYPATNNAYYTYSTPTIAGSNIDSVTAAASFTASNTRTPRSYTITWSYLSAYPNTGTTATQTYNYGDTPSRTSPSTVTNTSNDERKVFTSGDNLNTVTGNRTITANYKTQFAPTIKSNYCEANRSSGTWYDSGTVITGTAHDNYSFYGSKVKDTVTQTIDLGGTYSATPGYVKCTISGTNCQADKSNGSIIQVGKLITGTGNTGTNSKYGFSNTDSNSTTDTATVALGTTSYSKTASYLWYNVTSVTGTHCSAYNSNSYAQGFSTGGHTAGTKIYGKTTEDPYAMTTSNETTGSTEIQPGNNDRSAVVKQYTLSITKNTNVDSIIAGRTKSPYQGAGTSSSSSPLITSTGTATVYYGDSISMEAKAVRYCYFPGDKTILSINITATGNVTWSPTIARVATFKVTISAGTGVSSVYLSTNKNATSGSPSGTEFPAGTAVYAFAVLNTAGYTAPSGGEQVQGNIYRVGYAVMGYMGSPNFGTINATPKSTSTTYSLASGNAVTITLPSGAQMKVRNYGSKNDPDLYFSANFDLVVVADDYHGGSYELYGYPALAPIYIYNHNGYEHGGTDEGDGYDEAQFIMNNYTPIGVIRYNKANNSITVSAT